MVPQGRGRRLRWVKPKFLVAPRGKALGADQWRSYLSELYSDGQHHSEPRVFPSGFKTNKEEIEIAIRLLKGNTMPGPDGLAASYLRELQSSEMKNNQDCWKLWAYWLNAFYDAVASRGLLPKYANRNLLIPLAKKAIQPNLRL